ncbi:MAG: AbrB/MazE/SpoVT family DNA-binding domain-containing protein [Gammaproteobacteria bacterium]|nr:AbrB/MazE/SpoVT family DNA-binding domain-containing protein [Gammaproteobacteria bacterium]
MKAKLIQIGNSKGIRLPKNILDQCHLEDEVELEIEDNHLVITPVGKTRAGWANAFADMAQKGDDALLDQDSLPHTKWDETEWQW